MKIIKSDFMNLNAIIFLIFISFYGFSWQRQANILGNEDMISLSVDLSNTSVIYASSNDSVYRSINNGQGWQKVYSINKSNKQINKIYNDENSIYTCTQDGLYQSKNQSQDWQRIYIGGSDLENDCLSMAKANKAIYLGTKQGLYISYDQGEKWQKSSEQFQDSVVSSILVNPKEQNIIYAACEKGIYISEDNGNSWKRIFVVYGSEIPSEDYSDYDGDVSDKVLTIQSMAVSKSNPNRLYIATAKGMFFTEDKGKKWRGITKFGLPSLNIRSILEPGENQLIIATDKGVFTLKDSSWKKITNGFSFDNFYDVIFCKDSYLLVAGKGGIFKINREEGDENKNNNSIIAQSEITIDTNNLFKDEPSIEEVQEAAIEYAEVNMDKITNWRRQASLKALFPTVSVGYDKNVYGSSSGAMAVGPRSWDVGISWDVGELIWNADQTSIDSRSRLTVQLRQDILDQVTHLYYERRRLKAELLLSPPQDEKEKLDKMLQLEEITANLDGLTKGYFSSALEQ